MISKRLGVLILIALITLALRPTVLKRVDDNLNNCQKITDQEWQRFCITSANNIFVHCIRLEEAHKMCRGTNECGPFMNSIYIRVPKR
jgi:hypothetical protein